MMRSPFSALVRPMLRRLACERALALPMALGITVVLGISVTAVADYTMSNTRSAADSNQRSTAYAAAETGINDALSVLYNSGNFHSAASVPPVSSQSAGPAGATYSYSATFVDPIWTITATGTVPNKTQGTKPVSKTLVRKVTISTAAAGGVNTTVWNYIYSDAPPGSCLNLANNSSI